MVFTTTIVGWWMLVLGQYDGVWAPVDCSVWAQSVAGPGGGKTWWGQHSDWESPTQHLQHLQHSVKVGQTLQLLQAQVWCGVMWRVTETC